MFATTMIDVADVEAASAWYQRLLGLTSGHGGPDFEMLMSGKDLCLMLHRRYIADHGHPGSDGGAPLGNGVTLYFRLDEDFDAGVERAREMGVPIVQGPEFNELAKRQELWVTDPDGYSVVLAGPSSWGAS
jgi:catechol 2,3-dioxygenase-like lactoylglutathione lyase family enzyme